MKGIFVDTHAHLCDPAFDGVRDETVRRFRESGVYRVFEIACNPRDYDAAVRLADRYDEVFLAFGIHPDYARFYTEADLTRLRKYLEHPKCVALGEIGLDFHYKPFDREKQVDLFRRQLIIAQELELPVSLHVRDALGDCLDMLELCPVRGVMHCFSGSANVVDCFTKFGLYIAFGGALTFSSNKKAPAACAAVPMDRLLTETDCPYMAPEPNRGKRCEPSMIPLITAKMAAIKGVSTEEMANAVAENMRRLFSREED